MNKNKKTQLSVLSSTSTLNVAVHPLERQMVQKLYRWWAEAIEEQFKDALKMLEILQSNEEIEPMWRNFPKGNRDFAQAIQLATDRLLTSLREEDPVALVHAQEALLLIAGSQAFAAFFKRTSAKNGED